MSLIFSFVRMQRMIIQSGKYQLSDPSSRMQLNGIPVGGEQFQCDLSLKARVHPACVLNKQTQPPQRTAALNKCSQIVRQFKVFHGSGKHKLPRQQNILVRSDRLVWYFVIQVENSRRRIPYNTVCISNPDINTGRLYLFRLKGASRSASVLPTFSSAFCLRVSSYSSISAMNV